MFCTFWVIGMADLQPEESAFTEFTGNIRGDGFNSRLKVRLLPVIILAVVLGNPIRGLIPSNEASSL